MARPNSSVAATRLNIFQAFESLLKERSFKDISINDIIKRASVSRTTFYRHFQDKYALLLDMCQYYSDEIYENSATLKEYSLNNLRKYREHSELFINLMSMDSSVIFYDIFSNALLEQTFRNCLQCEPNPIYAPGIYIAIKIWCNGYIEAIRVWLEGGCPYPEEEFFEYLNDAMPKPIYNQFDYGNTSFTKIYLKGYGNEQ